MIAPPAATMRERMAASLERSWTDRGAVSAALLPAAWAFGAIAATRRQLFAHEWRQSSRLPVPVIVVGNVIVGGAGKTPTTIAVVDLLRRHGYRPGIVSRGYGRRDTGVVVVSRVCRDHRRQLQSSQHTPEAYYGMLLMLEKGQKITRKELLGRLDFDWRGAGEVRP